RGMGTAAIDAPRFEGTNSPVAEGYVIGGDLKFVSATLDDSLHSCDHDNFLDTNEDGRLKVTLSNPPLSVNLSGTTVSVSSSNPNLQFPLGNTISLPASHPTGTTTGYVRVRGAGSGIQVYDIQVQYNDPGLLVAGPRTATLPLTYGNIDQVASATDE